MNSSITRSLHYYLTGIKPAASLCQVWIKARSESIAKEVWLRFAGAARSSPGPVGKHLGDAKNVYHSSGLLTNYCNKQLLL